MLTQYIRAAMRRARYKILPEDGEYFGEIPGIDGVWASADTLEGCRDQLEEVLEEWIALSLRRLGHLFSERHGSLTGAHCESRGVRGPRSPAGLRCEEAQALIASNVVISVRPASGSGNSSR
jgi:predicted RNase H-like HicB family nuclease